MVRSSLISFRGISICGIFFDFGDVRVCALATQEGGKITGLVSQLGKNN